MNSDDSAIHDTRYARHELIAGWNQKKLASARVLVAGAGALGNEVLKLLALLGVGHITIIDFDTVELTNLTRSVLFREKDIGQSKAVVASRSAMEMNPDIRVIPLNCDLEFELGLGIVRSMDIVIGCLDSIRARLSINRMCRLIDVPWINGGIEMSVAESTYYDSRGGACYECGMSQEMWDQQNIRHSCSGLRQVTADDPVPTTAPISSITAGYMIQQALSYLDDYNALPQESKKIYLTFDPLGMSEQHVNQNPKCLAHEVWRDIKIYPYSASHSTPRDLMCAFEIESGVLELGFDLLTEMRCLECGNIEKIMRPLELCTASIIECPQCGAAARVAETIHQIHSGMEHFDTYISTLCVPEYQILELTRDTSIYVQITGYWPPDDVRK